MGRAESASDPRDIWVLRGTSFRFEAGGSELATFRSSFSGGHYNYIRIPPRDKSHTESHRGGTRNDMVEDRRELHGGEERRRVVRGSSVFSVAAGTDTRRRPCSMGRESRLLMPGSPRLK